jgi:hypothetical protein
MTLLKHKKMTKWDMVTEFTLELVLAFSKLSRMLQDIPQLRMILISVNVSSSGKIVNQALAR